MKQLLILLIICINLYYVFGAKEIKLLALKEAVFDPTRACADNNNNLVIPDGSLFAEFDARDNCYNSYTCNNTKTERTPRSTSCNQFYDKSKLTGCNGLETDEKGYLGGRGICTCYGGEMTCQRPYNAYKELPNDKLLYFVGISIPKMKLIRNRLDETDYERIGFWKDVNDDAEQKTNVLEMARKVSHTLNQLFLMERNESVENDTKARCRFQIMDNTLKENNFVFLVSNEILEPDDYGRSPDYRCDPPLRALDAKLLNRDYDHFLQLQTVLETQVMNGLPLSAATSLYIPLLAYALTFFTCCFNFILINSYN